MEVLIILIAAPFGILLLARFYNKAVADFSHDKKKDRKQIKEINIIRKRQKIIKMLWLKVESLHLAG